MIRPSHRAFRRARQAMRWARDAKREATALAESAPAAMPWGPAYWPTTHRNFAFVYWHRLMQQHVRRALEWHRLGRELQREEVRA